MKDTIVMRAFVPLEDMNAFLKDKDRVQKYFEGKYGDCSVVHEQHDTTVSQHRHEIVLQFLDPAIANKVKQKYNGRVLFGACTTTTFLTQPQMKNLRSTGSEKHKKSHYEKGPKSATPTHVQDSDVTPEGRGRPRDRRGREVCESRGSDDQTWQPSAGLDGRERRSRDREVHQHLSEDDYQRYPSATPEVWESRRSVTRLPEIDHQRHPSSSSSGDGREIRRTREMDSLQQHYSDTDHQRYSTSTDGRDSRRARELDSLQRHSDTDHQRYSSSVDPRKLRRSRETETQQQHYPDSSQRYSTTAASTDSRDSRRSRELDTQQADQGYRYSTDGRECRRQSRELDTLSSIDEGDVRRELEAHSETGHQQYLSSASNSWFLSHQNRRPQQNIFERLDKPQPEREHSATYYAGEAVIVHDKRRPVRGRKRSLSRGVTSFHSKPKRRNSRPSSPRSDRQSVHSPALSSSSSERIFIESSRPSDSTMSESPLIIIDELSQTPPSLPPPATSSVSSSPQPPYSLSPPPSPPVFTQSPPSLLDIPFPTSPADSDRPEPTPPASQPSPSSSQPSTTEVAKPILQPSLPTYLSISPPLSGSSLPTSPILVPIPISYPAGQGYQYQFFPPIQGFFPTQVYSWPYASHVSTTAAAVVAASESSRLARSRSGTPVMDEPSENQVSAPSEVKKEKVPCEVVADDHETSSKETRTQTDGDTHSQTTDNLIKDQTQDDSESQSCEQKSSALNNETETKTCSQTEAQSQDTETLTYEFDAQETETHIQEADANTQETNTRIQETDADTLIQETDADTLIQETDADTQETNTRIQETDADTLIQETDADTQETDADTLIQETDADTQETNTRIQETDADTLIQETDADTQETDADTLIQETDADTQETNTRTQETDADTQVIDSQTQEADNIMQQTEPNTEEADTQTNTTCQSIAVQTLEQPTISDETDSQSGDTQEPQSQTTTNAVVMQTMPISPASCASDPHSRTDNEQSDDGELAVSSTVTAMEIEEAMLEEDREEDTDQDELMSSEEFSPLTFQKTPAGVDYNMLKNRFMKDYQEQAQILATSCEVLLSQDPSMEDTIVNMLESSVKNLARKLLDQFREEAGIAGD